MTNKAEQMKKMRDDDAVGYPNALAKLKSVGEEISEVLKLFPKDGSAIGSALAEEQQVGLIEQVQSISGKIVKYIQSSIHAGMLRTMATIKSWHPQQDMQCLLEGANLDATDEQLAEYQTSSEPIVDQVCEDLG